MDKTLERYIKNDYLLLVDTCFILSDSFLEFFRSTLNKLSQNKQKLIIPREVIDEIENLKQKGKVTKEQYQEVNHFIHLYSQNNEIKVPKRALHKNHVDNLFTAKIMELRLRKNIVLFTNDSHLKKDVLALARSNSTSNIKDIQVYSIYNSKYQSLNNYNNYVKEDFEITDRFNKQGNNTLNLISVKDKIPYRKNQDLIREKYTKFMQGGEGIVYKNNNELIKIYHKENLDSKHEDKLKLLQALKNIPNTMLPKELVYNKDNHLIGFTMNFVEDSITLEAYFRKIITRQITPCRIDLINICLNLISITKKLHKEAVFVGDWNLKNILINPKSLEVNIIDTDSFQIGEFPCPVGATGFLDPDFINITKGQKIDSFFRNEANEVFSFCIILFQILMLGKAPFASKGNTNIESNEYYFPYRFNSSNEKEPEGNWKFIWHNFSFKVKEAFYDTFKHGKRYNLDWWEHILKSYKSLVEQGINSNKLIETKLKENTNKL